MKKLKKIIKVFVLLMIIALLAFGGVILYIKMSPKLEIKNANAFLMYDSQNELFFQGSGSQEWVNLEDISDKLIQATIYTEDKHFY